MSPIAFTSSRAIWHFAILSSIVTAFFLGIYIGAKPYQAVMGYVPKQSEWMMVWSNSVDCPVEIARDVNGRLQTLPVDYSKFKP